MKGLLIAERVRSGHEGYIRTMQDSGTVDFRTWRNLLSTTKAMHEEFLNVVRMRAPADDPRMRELSGDE